MVSIPILQATSQAPQSGKAVRQCRPVGVAIHPIYFGNVFCILRLPYLKRPVTCSKSNGDDPAPQVEKQFVTSASFMAIGTCDLEAAASALLGSLFRSPFCLARTPCRLLLSLLHKLRQVEPPLLSKQPRTFIRLLDRSLQVMMDNTERSIASATNLRQFTTLA